MNKDSSLSFLTFLICLLLKEAMSLTSFSCLIALYDPSEIPRNTCHRKHPGTDLYLIIKYVSFRVFVDSPLLAWGRSLMLVLCWEYSSGKVLEFCYMQMLSYLTCNGVISIVYIVYNEIVSWKYIQYTQLIKQHSIVWLTLNILRTLTQDYSWTKSCNPKFVL